jgi:hypothetical protein
MAWDASRDSQARPGAGDTPPGPSRGPNPLQVDGGLLSQFGRGIDDDRGGPGGNLTLNEADYRESDQGPGGSTPPAPTPPDSYVPGAYQYPTPRPRGEMGF